MQISPAPAPSSPPWYSGNCSTRFSFEPLASAQNASSLSWSASGTSITIMVTLLKCVTAANLAPGRVRRARRVVLRFLVLCLLIVGGEHVVPEVAARAAQHGVRVVAVAAGAVVLDQQVVALHPVVVRGARLGRALPGEVQLASGDPGRLLAGQGGGQAAQVQGGELAEQGAGVRGEAAGRDAGRVDAVCGAGADAGADVGGRLAGYCRGGPFLRVHGGQQFPGQVLLGGQRPGDGAAGRAHG